MMNDYLYPSCRVAFAALIHDIGKFAERAKIDLAPDVKEKNIHIFCPFSNRYGKHTHIHAAYTGIAIDAIERFLPAIKGDADTTPFQKEDADDSIITAAALFCSALMIMLARMISKGTSALENLEK